MMITDANILTVKTFQCEISEKVFGSLSYMLQFPNLVCVFQQGVQNINLGSRFRPHWLNSVRGRCQAVVAMAMLKTKDIHVHY